MARPEYDPSADPGNYPLVFLRAPVTHIQYHAHHDWFTANVGPQPMWLCVDRRVLQYIYGFGPFDGRPEALFRGVEPAVIDYFQHEALFRSLTPATEV